MDLIPNNINGPSTNLLTIPKCSDGVQFLTIAQSL
jgi:hypothetical protein